MIWGKMVEIKKTDQITKILEGYCGVNMVDVITSVENGRFGDRFILELTAINSDLVSKYGDEPVGVYVAMYPVMSVMAFGGIRELDVAKNIALRLGLENIVFHEVETKPVVSLKQY